jgi:hypothetical protein
VDPQEPNVSSRQPPSSPGTHTNDLQNRQSSMLGFSAIRGQFTKMMSKIYSAITGARETVHRLSKYSSFTLAE